MNRSWRPARADTVRSRRGALPVRRALGPLAFMPVAFRHVARELALVFAGVFVLLLSIGLGGRFIGFLQQAAVGRFSADVLWLLLALRVPEFVQVTAPFALALATLLVFGRLHGDQEFAAFTSAGAGPGRVMLWVLLFAVPLAGLVATLAFVITPDARRVYAELAREQLLRSGLEAASPGAFYVRSGGRRVTYAQAADAESESLRGVFMVDREGRHDVVVLAETARQHRSPSTGSQFLELRHGVRYEGAAGSADFRVVEFGRLGQRLVRAPPAPLRDARARRSADLDMADARQAAELHWRTALPLLTVIAALLTLGIARPPARGGRFARIMPGLGLFVGYYLLLVFAQDALADGRLPPATGLWPVHGLMFGLAAWLLRRSWRPA